MPENIQMICLVRLIVAPLSDGLLGAAPMTLVSCRGSSGVSAEKHCGRYRMAGDRSGAVGLTDGKGDLVRLYDWLAQRKITVREIALKRQEGNSVKIVLYIAMLRHFDKADSGCRRTLRVCSRLEI